MKLFTEKNTARCEPEAVRCNVCARAVEKNEMGYLMDYISLSKAWGFHSPFDGEAHDVDLCVDCYKIWISDFKIPPERAEEIVLI